MTSIERSRATRLFCLAVWLTAPSLTTAQTAADTARLAKASAYLETGGLRIGMSLKDVAPATRALNPLLKLTNTEKVTIWPTDTADYTKTPPPDAPESVRTLHLQTIQGAKRVTNETVVVTLAMYPNAPVVTTVNRVVQYPDGTGPNYTQVLDAIRAKFGPATETQVLSDSDNLRMSILRWVFDQNGKLLPTVAPYTLAPCGGNMSSCKDRSAFSVNVSAAGSGIVKAITFDMGSGPLVLSAQQATDAYLQSVEDDRTRKQNDQSKQRPLPKL